MSISDNLEKGKGAMPGFKRALDIVFMPLLIVLVGSISYGLGRFQDLRGDKVPVQIIKPDTYIRDEVVQGQGAGVGAALEPAKPASSAPLKAGQYVGSKTGSVYYLPWCGSVKRIKEENKIWFESKEAAEKAGYKPAKNCKGI